MLCIDVVYEGCPSYTTTSLIHNNVPHTQQRPSHLLNTQNPQHGQSFWEVKCAS